MNKKTANMAYWDLIDDMSDEYVKGLMVMSIEDIPQDEEKFEEKFDEDFTDVVTELGKEITEFATNLLKERLGAEFPFVDEDY